MPRCKVYEIKGPDANQTGGAERCVRDATGEVVLDGRRFRTCEHHSKDRWDRFFDGGWLYAVDPKAEPVRNRKGKK